MSRGAPNGNVTPLDVKRIFHILALHTPSASYVRVMWHSKCAVIVLCTIRRKWALFCSQQTRIIALF